MDVQTPTVSDVDEKVVPPCDDSNGDDIQYALATDIAGAYFFTPGLATDPGRIGRCGSRFPGFDQARG